MKTTKRVVLAMMFLGAVVTAVAAQPAPATGGDDFATLARDLDLDAAQKDQIRDLGDEAVRRQARLTLELQAAEGELVRTLEDPAAGEQEVETLVMRVSTLEGELRASRLVAWFKIRKVLTAAQRTTLERMQSQTKAVHAIVTEVTNQSEDLRIVVDKGSNHGLAIGSRGTLDAITGSTIEVIQVSAEEATCRVKGATMSQVMNAGRAATLWP